MDYGRASAAHDAAFRAGPKEPKDWSTAALSWLTDNTNTVWSDDDTALGYECKCGALVPPADADDHAATCAPLWAWVGEA